MLCSMTIDLDTVEQGQTRKIIKGAEFFYIIKKILVVFFFDSLNYYSIAKFIYFYI